MADFEILVAGYIRVTKRYNVTRVADSEAGSQQVLRHATENTPWRNRYFKVDPLAAPRDVETVKVTPLNQKSASADRAAKAAREAVP